MKVKLTENRCARVSVKFGAETPELERPIVSPRGEVITDPLFRSCRITLQVYENDPEMTTPSSNFSGISYCSPLDQFNKFEGRKRAMKRLMSLARKHLPKKDWQILCPVMLRGKRENQS